MFDKNIHPFDVLWSGAKKKRHYMLADIFMATQLCWKTFEWETFNIYLTQCMLYYFIVHITSKKSDDKISIFFYYQIKLYT